MAIPAPLTTKFVRYFDAPSFSDNGSIFGLWLRLVYEFWGFCINGTDDLKHPGGFPTGSAPNIHMSGVINMPAGWESGSNILIRSGSDGQTLDGMPWFTGSNFQSTDIGKYLTIRKSGSTCTDDSIYLITKTYFPGSATSGSVIGVDLNMGGTPYSGSLKPSFTARTNINYRVIDYGPINQTHTVAHHIVLQLNGAPYVNVGQKNSQARLRLATYRGDTFPRGIAILMSPSGTWNGSGFTDGTLGGNATQVGGPPGNVGEFGPNSGNSFDWHNGGGGTQCINLIGAQDFLILYARGGFASNGCGFHLEIPQRLYPLVYDPNPICAMGFSYGLYMFNPGTNNGYGVGVYLYTADNNPRPHFATGHHQAGDFYNPIVGSPMYNLGNSIYNHMWFNPFTNKFFFSDIILGHNSVTGQHYLARTRMRRVRVIAPIIPAMHRLGDRGEWLHVNQGVMWPWDNAVLPQTIFHQGL